MIRRAAPANARCSLRCSLRSSTQTASSWRPDQNASKLNAELDTRQQQITLPVAYVTVSSVFDFDSSEYYRALRVVSRHTAARWLSWGFGALALVLAAVSVRDGWGRVSPVALFLNALPWVLLGVFWVAFLPISQRRAARSLPKRDASVQGPQERTVDASGFHSRGNGVALDVPWHAMVQGLESDEFFLFFYSKQLAYYLPKRVLSGTQIEEVRTLMRSGLGERARLLGD